MRLVNGIVRKNIYVTIFTKQAYNIVYFLHIYMFYNINLMKFFPQRVVRAGSLYLSADAG